MDAATHDENVPAGQVPTPETIGRQVKRCRVAEVLEQSPDAPGVDLASVGNRHARLVQHSLALLVDAPADGHQQGMMAAFTAVLNVACQPGGAVAGAINQAINSACQPGGGVIHNLIQQSAGAQAVREDARFRNGMANNDNYPIAALPNSMNMMPAHFPPTVGAFYAMNAAQVQALLEFYGLAANGTAAARIKRIGQHCRVQRPLV